MQSLVFQILTSKKSFEKKNKNECNNLQHLPFYHPKLNIVLEVLVVGIKARCKIFLFVVDMAYTKKIKEISTNKGNNQSPELSWLQH